MKEGDVPRIHPEIVEPIQPDSATVVDFNTLWNERKKQSAQENQRLADKTFWRGKYWEKGQANPGGVRQEDGTLLRNGVVYDIRMFRGKVRGR